MAALPGPPKGKKSDPAHIKAQKAWEGSRQRVHNLKKHRLGGNPRYLELVRAQRAYKGEVFRRILVWRAEMKEQKLREGAALRAKGASLASSALASAGGVDSAKKQQLEQLEEGLRKAELELAVVSSGAGSEVCGRWWWFL